MHFIHYSTEHHFQKGSPQHTFIEAALAAVDRSVTPWVVFAGVLCFFIRKNYFGPGQHLQVSHNRLACALLIAVLRMRYDLPWHPLVMRNILRPRMHCHRYACICRSGPVQGAA